MRLVFPHSQSGRLMDDLATDVGTLFETFLGDVADRGRGGKPLRFAPAMDVSESGDAYRVTMDVPGVQLESIEIDVHEDTLTVAGSRGLKEGFRSSPADAEAGCCGDGGSSEDSCCNEPAALKHHRRERVVGQFERKLQLPLPVEADAVSAELADGVLTVRLPKADPDKGKRRIPVAKG